MADTRFIQCLHPDGHPRDWTPPTPILELVDTWYFGRALEAMERDLKVDGLVVYLTFDTETLPSYGENVVVVLIGDEWARVPAYLSRVRVVFRNLSARPNLGYSLARPSLLALSSILPAARAAAKGAPRRVARLRPRRRPAPQVELPIGTFNALDLPVTPFAERRFDLFFAGSLVHSAGRAGAAKARIMPKGISREAMLRNVESLRRKADIAVDLRITESFSESAESDAGDYSRALMDSRLALVPRGATTETHRFFQALKYGCVVVTDSLPPIWFYEQAPVVRLRHWDELEDKLMPLLARPERLEALHRQALRWWENACSEEAVGRLMARSLNALA